MKHTYNLVFELVCSRTTFLALTLIHNVYAISIASISTYNLLTDDLLNVAMDLGLSCSLQQDEVKIAKVPLTFK